MNHSPISRHKAVFVGTALLLGLVALHLLWLVFGWGGETHRALLGNVLYIIPSAVTAFVVLSVALNHQGKARRGWFLIGLGLSSQVVGNSIWLYLEVIAKTEPFPSPGDFFYLMFGPLLVAGLLQLMPPPRDRLEGSRLALDLAITVGAVGLFFWRYLLAPPLTWGMTSWVTGITLAYPLLDLLLLSLLLLMVMRERRIEPPRLELLLLGMGVAGQVGGDLLFSAAVATDSYYTGHPADGLWTTSMAFFGLAAFTTLTQHHTPVIQRAATLHSYLTVAMPYLAVASGLGLLLTTQANLLVRDTLDGKGVLYGAVRDPAGGAETASSV